MRTQPGETPTGRPLLQVHQPGYLLMCLFSQALCKTELNLNELANQQRAFTVVYTACGVVQSKSIYIYYKMIQSHPYVTDTAQLSSQIPS